MPLPLSPPCLPPPSLPGCCSDMTLVVETMGKAAAPGTAFSLVGGLPGPGSRLHVWQTTQDAWFVALPDVVVAADGSLSLDLPADGIVTATTLATGSHGQPASPIPAPAPFPLPYADDFSGPYDSMAKYLSDQVGRGRRMMGGEGGPYPAPATLYHHPYVHWLPLPLMMLLLAASAAGRLLLRPQRLAAAGRLHARRPQRMCVGGGEGRGRGGERHRHPCFVTPPLTCACRGQRPRPYHAARGEHALGRRHGEGREEHALGRRHGEGGGGERGLPLLSSPPIDLPSHRPPIASPPIVSPLQVSVTASFAPNAGGAAGPGDDLPPAFVAPCAAPGTPVAQQQASLRRGGEGRLWGL